MNNMQGQQMSMAGQQQQQQQQQPQQQQQKQQSVPTPQPQQPQGQGQQGDAPDYSAQWAQYYRSLGKIQEAEAIEAQMKAKVCYLRYLSNSLSKTVFI